ncbi:MAG: pyrroline-5-carboxylate reductase [Firmicutes bacterium]|nr:pyrroline-5-carboxylate reductase [Bacillota bacterium]
MRANDSILSTPIGFIGCGNMARAIIRALHTKGYYNIFVHDPNPEQTQKVCEIAQILPSCQRVIKAAHYIFICVKPQNAHTVLGKLKFTPDKIPISVMAGITLNTIAMLTKTPKAVRVMPNVNAGVKMSHNAYCLINVKSTELRILVRLLSSFGKAVKTDERLMSAVTGISGSGPAYVFRFLKGLMKEASKHGFSPDDALSMCTHMIVGSMATATMFANEYQAQTFEEIITGLDLLTTAICSKGGTTIQGVKYLDNHNFTKTVAAAAAKAVKRAEELNK